MEEKQEAQNLEGAQNVQRKVVKRDRKKKLSRSKKTIIAVGVTAIALVVATYAWFVGITRVQVDKFEVEVVTTEGLQMSLDGKNWGSNVRVSKGIILGTENIFVDNTDTGDVLIGTGGTYPDTAGNVNHWASAGNDSNNTGLEPVSAPGKLFYNSSDSTDTKNSQARFYAKTTMTSEKGGYKVAAGEVTSPTAKGYISFDLFLKNSAGATYDSTYRAANDEAIFLTKGSYAKYNTSGGTAGQGIENSLRLGFYALGRVDAATDFSTAAGLSKIQGISCAAATDVTNLCNIDALGVTSNAPVRGDNWNIWEPNDLKHREDSIIRFNGACIRRDTNGLYFGDTGYAGANTKTCDSLGVDATTFAGYVDTYTIADDISLSAATDSNIYDGHNDYTNPKMYDVPTLTDTENRNEATRGALLHIAPSSITKIRVYIYLEGQDIDNFDLAAEYQTLKILFGFTKERFDESTVVDSTTSDATTTS